MYVLSGYEFVEGSSWLQVYTFAYKIQVTFSLFPNPNTYDSKIFKQDDKNCSCLTFQLPKSIEFNLCQ